MRKHRSTVIRILDSLAIIVFIASFSPLVIPENESAPYMFGIPYTMWMGLFVSILYVVLAYAVSTLNKENKNAD
ncbi:hypothetical protein [Pareuzebyella sediminis]|uniref:hypothetical protein n=1 Tax=Pareuzebyella sediminis TaxID=2607998 RepID=UPI0011ECBFEA|nr:hypothetical protein [Pareuzebyella sediminis]